MKKFFHQLVIAVTILVVFSFPAYSQNVAVTDDDSYTANPSAMMDVKSISKGLLVPRLTTAQRTLISSPAAGLMVYDTDLKRFYFYTGSSWQDVSDQGLWVISGKDITLADTTYNISIGSKKTAGKLSVKGDNNIGINEPLFSVVNTSGDTVFAVYSEGVRIYVKDEPGKASGNKGGFAVGGFTPAKGVTNEFFRVTADSVRIYVDTAQSSKATGNKGGFAVGGYTSTKGILHNNYLSVSDDSVRIYIQEPKFKGSGSKGGFAVGGFTPSKGVANEFLRVTSDSTRVFVKDSTAGFGIASIENGTTESFMDLTTQNYLIGHKAGNALTTGVYNNINGYLAGYNMNTGKHNILLGFHSGYNITQGSNNIFIGNYAGYLTDVGGHNVFIGTESGYANTITHQGTFVGYRSGYGASACASCMFGSHAGENSSGCNNTFVGMSAGMSSQGGGGNTFIGSGAGGNTIVSTGQRNIFLGLNTGSSNNTGNDNIFIGQSAGGNNDSGSDNIFIGKFAGMSNSNGTGNVYIGKEVARYSNFSNKLLIDNADVPNPLISGDFSTDDLTINGNLHVADTYFRLTNNPGSGATPAYYSYQGAVGNTSKANAFAIYDALWVTDNAWFDAALNTTGILTTGDHININTTNGALYTAGDEALWYDGTYFSWGYGGTHNRFADKVRIGGTDPGSYMLWVDGAAGGTANWTTSDKQYKKNIMPLNNALEKVIKLQGRSYEFRTDEFRDMNFTTGTNYGLIAQEIQEIIPEAVQKDPNGYYAINYQEIIPFLIEAIKEQQKMIEELKDEVKKQKSSNQQINKSINQ